MSDKTKKQILGLIKVPAEQRALIIYDAKHFKKSKDGVVQVALYHFFLLTATERAQLYARLPDKIFGRPIL